MHYRGRTTPAPLARCGRLALIAAIAHFGWLLGVAAEASFPGMKPGDRPFVREIGTGYLLNYSFMSPRPYCWTAEDCYLSGWQVDGSGGHFEFSPTGDYPEDFGFHLDWFKLVDTSPADALILRHQVARQVEGELTLEFRFRLPAPMAGARWQLRDLQDTGVSLEIADGNLCYEQAGGQMTVLQPIEVDREYGVRLIADLDAKKAVVFVDGQLRAKELPFLKPVDAVDYVLVKTGDAATGEMYLAPVNLFKGYHVNETFVSGGAGSLPSDWDGVAGPAVVDQFECGNKPDIYSLRLSGGSDMAAKVTKKFVPLPEKTVWEYRFLLPAKIDGVWAELGSGTKGVVRLITKGGDLCFEDGRGGSAPLVRNYRANLWYMIRMIIDQKTGVADVLVNGKRMDGQAAFRPAGAAIDRVSFSSPGLMWIDDVQVFAWQDYPADYVPEPRPVTPKDGLLLGVQSCNLWQEGRAYAGWDYIYPYRDQREPYLGWYDEGNPEVTDWETKWKLEHGIGFEQHCWYRPNNAVNRPIKDGVLDHGIIKGLFNSRYGDLTKFTIMYTNDGAGLTNIDDFLDNIIPYWIEYFFKDPRYLKVEGKPVLSVYQASTWNRMFGGAEGGAAAMQALRDEVAKAGFPGIIVMMEERTGEREDLRTIKNAGADYCFSYTWLTSDEKVQRAKMLTERDQAAAVGLGVIPSLSMGWDREAWGVHDGGWLSFTDFKSLGLWTRDVYQASLPAKSLGRRMVLLANWNEFGEGHFLLPNVSGGFTYLDILREVFSTAEPHRDIRPTERQKSRFTVLYPRD